MRRYGLILLLLWGGWAAADEQVAICYNYGCIAEARVTFSEPRLAEVATHLAAARTALEERTLLAQEIGQLYRWAGEQSPIAADRPGDFLDGGEYGMMDCIDHAESTTRLLAMLEKRGALHFHVLMPIRRRVRWLVTQHFSAVIREVSDAQAGGGAQFVVDTWFGEHGDPAVILPLEDWLDGEGPNVS